jgi:hypothetical protein
MSKLSNLKASFPHTSSTTELQQSTITKRSPIVACICKRNKFIKAPSLPPHRFLCAKFKGPGINFADVHVQVLCLKGICSTLMEADFCAIAGLNHLQVTPQPPRPPCYSEPNSLPAEPIVEHGGGPSDCTCLHWLRENESLGSYRYLKGAPSIFSLPSPALCWTANTREKSDDPALQHRNLNPRGVCTNLPCPTLMKPPHSDQHTVPGNTSPTRASLVLAAEGAATR